MNTNHLIVTESPDKFREEIISSADSMRYERAAVLGLVWIGDSIRELAASLRPAVEPGPEPDPGVPYFDFGGK